MRISEIYLDETRFNPVINATVHGAWIVRYENGNEVAICPEYKAKNEKEAREILDSVFD